MPDAIALQAVRDALDRAGLNPKTAVDVEVTAKPYERILENVPRLYGGSRAEWRRSQGIADDSDKHPTALVAADVDAPVDAEIVDDDELSDAVSDQHDAAHPTTPDTGDRQPAEPLDGNPNPFGPTDPPPEGLMPLDEAVIRAARINNMATAGHAKVRRGQRALPRGRS